MGGHTAGDHSAQASPFIGNSGNIFKERHYKNVFVADAFFAPPPKKKVLDLSAYKT